MVVFPVVDSLLRIRSVIPCRLSFFRQLLTQREALVRGQQEIAVWLDRAEELLNSLHLGGGKAHLQSQLERHEVTEIKWPREHFSQETSMPVFSLCFRFVKR